VWPVANGGLDDRKTNARLQRKPKVGPDTNLGSIVRLEAVDGLKDVIHLYGGF
jgi:hypothetical protein